MGPAQPGDAPPPLTPGVTQCRIRSVVRPTRKAVDGTRQERPWPLNDLEVAAPDQRPGHLCDHRVDLEVENIELCVEQGAGGDVPKP